MGRSRARPRRGARCAAGRGRRRGRRLRFRHDRRSRAAEDPVRRPRVPSADGRAVREQAPSLSYPKWDRTKYSGSFAGEWLRLDAACKLDRPAALQSASWGMFQIMGFNYAYCGCSDVEAFVALQHAGADEQMDCFARFVERPPYLEALHAKDWAQFAARVQRARAREEQLRAEEWRPRTRSSPATTPARGAQARGRSINPSPHSRRRSAAETATRRHCRRAARRSCPWRDAQAHIGTSATCGPTPSILRDWEYRPASPFAPPDELWSKRPRKVKHQGDTNACTGFSLATVLEYLLERRAGEARARRSRASCSTAWRAATTSGPRRTRTRTAARRCAAR